MNMVDCEAEGGEPQAPWMDCTPNPCVPTAMKDATWGEIRVLYR